VPPIPITNLLQKRVNTTQSPPNEVTTPIRQPFFVGERKNEAIQTFFYFLKNKFISLSICHFHHGIYPIIICLPGGRLFFKICV
jgi:hypothetical protein